MKKPETLPIVLHASLEGLVNAQGMDPKGLTVGLQEGPGGVLRIESRHIVPVCQGKEAVMWQVPALGALFRGDRKPPADMKEYPPFYVPAFHFVETHVLHLCRAKGDRTDQEMEEIYATLRRRPEGRSLGLGHDFMWQVCALMLGMYELSEAEYLAVISRLEASVRTWALRPVSRFYVGYLKNTFE